MNYDMAILFLRIGIAFLYIYAAYMNSKDKASLKWTVDNTLPLFRNTQIAKNPILIKWIAYVGILVMYVGGASILLGVESRLGAFLLFIFTIGGTIIHQRLKNDAKEIAINNPTNLQLSNMAWSAFSAHFANILKNICLVLIFIFIILNGVGKYQISDMIFKILSK